METLEAKMHESKPKPIRPRPRPIGKGNKVSMKDTTSGMSLLSRVVTETDTYLEDTLLRDSEIDEAAGKVARQRSRKRWCY